MFEVFSDTIVICTITAVTILISGVEIAYNSTPGRELLTAAFSSVFGEKVSCLFVATAMIVFAFSTVIGWSLYGMRCAELLPGSGVIEPFIVLFSMLAIIGCALPSKRVWELSDLFNGLMAIQNFAALFALSDTVERLTNEHFINR